MKRLQLILFFIFLTAKISFASDTESYFFVYLNSNPDKNIISEDSAQFLQNAHLANIERLYTEGKIVAAGPFTGGGGLFIFKMESIEETKELLATDPGINAKRWKLEVLPMNILKGGICQLGENYEMTSYTFVRFVKDPHDASLNTAELLESKERLVYLNNEENKIIIAASYGKKSGGFLILQTKDGVIAENILEKDPATTKTELLYSSKILWIAKGTFCE